MGDACLYYTHTQTNDKKNTLPKKCSYRPQIITMLQSHWLESIGLPDLACEIRLAQMVTRRSCVLLSPSKYGANAFPSMMQISTRQNTTVQSNKNDQRLVTRGMHYEISRYKKKVSTQLKGRVQNKQGKYDGTDLSDIWTLVVKSIK